MDTVIDYIHKIAVQSGDAIFLPAGRVHAIGAGNLLIEIQQNSDTTYRVFDWNRTDPTTGKKRDLHIEQAIQCIDFEDVQPKLIQSEGELLISHSLFEIRKWNLDEAREAAPLGQFAIVCCLTGNLSCAKAELAPGELFLSPGPFGGPATETTRAQHKSVARDDSGVEAAVSAAKDYARSMNMNSRTEAERKSGRFSEVEADGL